MKPALQLASQFLANANLYPWYGIDYSMPIPKTNSVTRWDALVEGKWEEIHPDQLPETYKKDKFYRFRLRDVSKYRTAEARARVQRLFTDAVGQFDLRFTSGRVDYRSGYPEGGDSITYGRTVGSKGALPRIIIRLSGFNVEDHLPSFFSY